MVGRQGKFASASCRTIAPCEASPHYTCHPDIEILLHSLIVAIDLLAEGDALELVEHGLLKPPRRCHWFEGSCLGAGMVMSDSTVELVFVAVVGAQYSVPRS